MKLLHPAVASLFVTSLACAVPVVHTDLASWSAAVGATTHVNFDDLAGGTALGAQYSGVGITFSGTPGPKVENGPAFSTSNPNYFRVSSVVDGGGGNFTATFSEAMAGISFFTHGVQFVGSVVSLYDSSSALIATYDLYTSGTGHGATVIGFNGYSTSTPQIASFRVDVFSGDAVRFDDFRFSPIGVGSTVPDHGSVLGMTGLAMALLVSARRRATLRQA